MGFAGISESPLEFADFNNLSRIFSKENIGKTSNRGYNDANSEFIYITTFYIDFNLTTFSINFISTTYFNNFLYRFYFNNFYIDFILTTLFSQLFI